MLPPDEQHHVEQRQRHDKHHRRRDPRPRARSPEARRGGRRRGRVVRRRVGAKAVPKASVSVSKPHRRGGGGRRRGSGLLSVPRLAPRRGLGQRRKHRRSVGPAADLAAQQPAALDDPGLEALEVRVGDRPGAGAGADEGLGRAGLEADAALGERESGGGGGGSGGGGGGGGLGGPASLLFFSSRRRWRCCCYCRKGV